MSQAKKILFFYFTLILSPFLLFHSLYLHAYTDDHHRDDHRAEQCACPCDYEKPQLTWGGFINTDMWWDTRQNVTKRHGNELLYPRPKKLDNNNCDINDHPDYGIIPFVVRLTGRLDGPALLCSNKTHAFFSGDFRGVDDATTPLFRFRKGYVKFEWDRFDLLIGQDNHPMYMSDCKPNTVAYSKGAPIAARPRVPQVRVTWRPNPCDESAEDKIICAIYSHSRTTRSRGPDGPHVKYIQDGLMPAMDMQWRKELDDFTFCGIGADFKRIVPRLSTLDMLYKDDKSITSGLLYVYFSHNRPEFSVRTKMLYIHDGSEFGFLSGYAVDCEDPITKKRTYTNLRSFSYWLDMDVCPESQLSPGIFLGVARNLGSDKRLFRDPDNNQHIIFAGEPAIRLLGRAAPRIWYTCGPITFGAEVEWTYAEYGTLDDFGKASLDTSGVSNVRFLGSIYYYF